MFLHQDLPARTVLRPTPGGSDTGMNLLLEAADALDDAAGAREEPEEATRFSALADRARRYVAPTPQPTRPATTAASPRLDSYRRSPRAVITQRSYEDLLKALGEAQTAGLVVRDLGPAAYESPRNSRVEPALVHAEERCETALAEIRAMLNSIWLTV